MPAGYVHDMAFYMGELDEDPASLNWGGKGNATYDQIIDELYFKIEEDILIPYRFNSTASKLFLPLHGNCVIMRVNHTQLIHPHLLAFNSRAGVSVPLEVFVVDLNWSVDYTLVPHTGEPIVLDQSNHTHGMFYEFRLKFEQREWTRVGRDCTAYGPEGGFRSYAACVAEAERRRVLPVLGCMLPWMSSSDRCVGLQPRWPRYSQLLLDISNQLLDMMGGLELTTPTCLPPCTQVRARASRLGAQPSGKNTSTLLLFLEAAVTKKTFSPAYGLPDFFVELGSSLGLWLGLSTVGLFDAGLGTLEFVRKRIK